MRFTTNCQVYVPSLAIAATDYRGPLFIEKWEPYRFVHLPTKGSLHTVLYIWTLCDNLPSHGHRGPLSIVYWKMIGYRCIRWFSAINRGPPTLHQSANMILLFFSLGSCPSKKCQKVAYMHTVALTDSASRNLFLKSFENFKGLF